MFRLKTAWFSSSVSQDHLNFWVLEGGTIMGWRAADYLFSEDATCPDTLRIFESKDYLWNKVTVFHSLFLSACEKRQSVKSVCIGHYVLPPASVQDEVRKVVGRLIWERDGEQSVAESDRMCLTKDECSEEEGSTSDCESSDTSSSEIAATLCGHLRNPTVSTLTDTTLVIMAHRPPHPVNGGNGGGLILLPCPVLLAHFHYCAYVSMDSLQKYSADLCDFHPRHFICSECKAHFCLTHT